jgi:hypothetical protein
MVALVAAEAVTPVTVANAIDPVTVPEAVKAIVSVCVVTPPGLVPVTTKLTVIDFSFVIVMYAGLEVKLATPLTTAEPLSVIAPEALTN